jgi:hypothetical protein
VTHVDDLVTKLPSRPMGLRAGVDLDKALRLADELEDVEIVRKLELPNLDNPRRDASPLA